MLETLIEISNETDLPEILKQSQKSFFKCIFKRPYPWQYLKDFTVRLGQGFW